MSVYSVVFSPTGGTKKVADLFANAFVDGCADTYVEIDMTKADFEGFSFKENDICIVSVPSFGGRVPAKAAERMTALQGNEAKAVLITAATGIPTMIGAVLGFMIGDIGAMGLALSLGFASGAMLYVVFGEILPQAILMYHSKAPAFSAIGGMLVGLLIIFG